MPGQNGVDASAKPEVKLAPGAAQPQAKRPQSKTAAPKQQRPAAAAAAQQEADPFPQPVAPAPQTTGGTNGTRAQ